MSIRNEPHYRIMPAEVAAWIERQGDHWWTIDGDPLLGGRLSIPCPGDELAAELRKIKKPLLVLDRRKEPRGDGSFIDSVQLDALATLFWDPPLAAAGPEPPVWLNERFFYFSWEGDDNEWVLREDLRTTESERRELATEQGSH